MGKLAKVAPAQIGNDANLVGLTQRVRQELDRLDHDAAMLPVRAVLLGCIALTIKDELGHGHFGAYAKKHFGRHYRTIRGYMQIAGLAVEQKRLRLPALHVTGQLKLELTNLDKDDSIVRKVKAWVGKRSIRDLIQECATTPQLGGARSNTGRKSVIDPAALHAQKRDEVSELIERGRRLLLEENALQFLQPDEIRGVVESVEALATELKQAVRPLLKKG